MSRVARTKTNQAKRSKPDEQQSRKARGQLRKYHKAYEGVTGCAGNPLLQILEPLPKQPNRLLDMLIRKPDFQARQRALDTNIRTLLTRELLRFCFPTQQHVTLLNSVHEQIVDGYRFRNPLERDGQYYLHHAGECGYVACGAREFPATISFITGLSGTGKSRAIDTVLSAVGGPIIKHFRPIPAPGDTSGSAAEEQKMFTDTQLISLRVNIPPRATTKSLASRCCERVDELLKLQFYEKAVGHRLTREGYISELRKVIAANHVGILVLDEFQNVTLVGTSGIAELVAMLINLREELGIPIVVIGTYRAEKAFVGVDGVSFGSSRRLGEGFFMDYRRPISASDPFWRVLCEESWRYQWVRRPRGWRDDIAEVLYDCCQGITGIMLCLLRAAQIRAMESRVERVDEDLLRKVYEEDFVPVHECMNALHDGTDSALAQYEDMFPQAYRDLKVNKLESEWGRMKADMVKAYLERSKDGNPSQHRSKNGSNGHERQRVTRQKARKGVAQSMPLLVEPAATLPSELG